MLDFIVSPRGVYGASGQYPVRVSIPEDGSYAFFARYFRDAEIPPAKSNFLGFWGCTELTGYQLVRLRRVLEDALLDLSARPVRFKVLPQWSSGGPTEETEVWKEVARDDLVEIATELIAAIDLARSTTDHIFAQGD